MCSSNLAPRLEAARQRVAQRRLRNRRRLVGCFRTVFCMVVSWHPMQIVILCVGIGIWNLTRSGGSGFRNVKLQGAFYAHAAAKGRPLETRPGRMIIFRK